jgi:hypothetical protein
MERDLFAWADLAMDIVQGVALAAILWQLFYLRRSVLAVLRVLRRTDRKMPEPRAKASESAVVSPHSALCPTRSVLKSGYWSAALAVRLKAALRQPRTEHVVPPSALAV